MIHPNSDDPEFLASPGASGGTVRIGATVRRPEGRAPAAMRLVLNHLAAVGFAAAPRVLGQDERGRWMLTFIPGQVALPPYPSWVASDELLVSVASLLRRYHDAVSDLRPPDGVTWPTAPPAEFGGSLVCHMDVSMANVVCRNGRAAALIDFELVGPAAPVWDVIRTARHWIPLLDPADLTGGLGRTLGRQPERLALFARTYRLSDVDRARFVDGVLLSADTSYDRMRRGAAQGHPGYLREWTGMAARRNRRGRAWVSSHRAELEDALLGS